MNLTEQDLDNMVEFILKCKPKAAYVIDWWSDEDTGYYDLHVSEIIENNTGTLDLLELHQAINEILQERHNELK